MDVDITAKTGYTLSGVSHSAGWSGSAGHYYWFYEPEDSSTGYSGYFDGEAIPDTTGGGGEGEGQPPDYRFDVYVHGSLDSLIVTPQGNNLVPVGESKEYTAKENGSAVESNWTWKTPDMPSGSTFTPSPPTGTTSVTAYSPEANPYELQAALASDQSGKTTACAAYIPTGVQKIEAWQTDDSSNIAGAELDVSETTPLTADRTQPEETPVLYVPYTEDENDESTTKITLFATSFPNSTFPDERPTWILKEKPDGAEDLPSEPGDQFDYIATKPGSYKFTAECGNTLEVEVTIIKFEYVHALGENESEEMKYLPIFTPNDGIGCGEPIYDTPESPLIVIFDAPLSPDNIDSLTATFFGRELTMQETASDSLRFESADGTRILEFDEIPESDKTNICQITDTVEGITDAGYQATAVEDAALTYEAFTPAIKIVASPWKENEINEIVFAGDVFSETEIGSRVFFNETYGYEITILDGAEQTTEIDSWRILLSYGSYAQDALFIVEETGATTLVFRNCDPPISTNSPPSEPEDFVPWRVKILGLEMDQVESLTVKSPMASVVVDEFISGSILTKDVFVLVPPGTTSAQVPGGDYKLLHIDPSLISTVPDVAQTVKSTVQFAFLGGCTRQPDPGEFPLRTAQVFKSFGFTSWGTGAIANAVEHLGYNVTKNGGASKDWVLDNAVEKDVGVWYAHGSITGVAWTLRQATVFESPNNFRIKLKDEQFIGKQDLQSLNLDCRFAFMMACASGWTGGSTRQESLSGNTMTAGVRGFADQFGSNVAYVGFAWAENPSNVKKWGLEFLGLLEGGRTVAEALEEYNESSRYPNTLKGYSPGNGLGQPVDAKHIDWEGE